MSFKLKNNSAPFIKNNEIAVSYEGDIGNDNILDSLILEVKEAWGKNRILAMARGSRIDKENKIIYFVFPGIIANKGGIE